VRHSGSLQYDSSTPEPVQLVLLGMWGVSVILLLLALRSYRRRWVKVLLSILAALALGVSGLFTVVAALSM
jgi:hypothetical protein